MLLVVVWPWYWPEGSHNCQRLKAMEIMAARRSLSRPFNMGFTGPLWDFTGPLWDLLRHYGLCCTCHIA